MMGPSGVVPFAGGQMLTPIDIERSLLNALTDPSISLEQKKEILEDINSGTITLDALIENDFNAVKDALTSLLNDDQLSKPADQAIVNIEDRLLAKLADPDMAPNWKESTLQSIADGVILFEATELNHPDLKSCMNDIFNDTSLPKELLRKAYNAMFSASVGAAPFSQAMNV
jgi:hypothetical protein